MDAAIYNQPECSNCLAIGAIDTHTAWGEGGGQAIVINFITLQGEGGQKRSKHWVRTKSMAPYSNQNFNHIFFKIHHI